jgi:hypothetical protein
MTDSKDVVRVDGIHFKDHKGRYIDLQMMTVESERADWQSFDVERIECRRKYETAIHSGYPIA